jgi:type II restriction/modification system DNA methylase subunit YeeA
VKVVHRFNLDQLGELANIDVLRKLFTDPHALKPQETREQVTKDLAARFARIADGMRDRQVKAADAAHFLMKLMFCMFAEDIDLLPGKIFGKVLAGSRHKPADLSRRLHNLFQAMATGQEFGADVIAHFNGGLFADADVVDLLPGEIDELIRVNDSDWGNVEPSIFGTLFERTLDPDKRSQIGAHYTSRADIETLLEPVVLAPLRCEWEDVKARCEKLRPKIRQAAAAAKGKRARTAESKYRKQHDDFLADFGERLERVTILDPACGSGNFLYVAIHLLLDLEKQLVTYASQRDLSLLPRVSPRQLAGLEINPYAQQLAQVVIWIGFLQCKHQNGYGVKTKPVLDPMENVRRTDAILDLPDPANPKEPEWPAAEFVVGNPPFLGGKLLRTNLGDDYVDALYRVWRERVRPEADLCCYWFEKARQQIAAGKCSRAGLLATQGIRGGANRDVLKRIKEAGDIFFAISDRDWILDGAHVHVSMVGFDRGDEKNRILDGQQVLCINPNLTATFDITTAPKLGENAGMSIQGDNKVGAFEINEAAALDWLIAPNPSGVPNSDAVRPWTNGTNITKEKTQLWIIDFAPALSLAEAAQYAGPFEYIKSHIFPVRSKNRRASRAERWWIHGDPQKAMRRALGPLA